MIYIEKSDKVVLPKEFHKRHNISVVLYDFLADIIKRSRYRGLKSTRIPLDQELRKIINEVAKGGIHILDHLQNNDRKTEIITVLTKQVFISVLHDMTSFLYESLSCAKKGKMSVAYSLLRKPLTDELLILEQLLNDKDDFIDRFYFKGETELYDPSTNRVGHEKLKVIISKVTDSLGMISPLFKESIYDFRYNKASISGLHGMMNHAHHIVTADKNYKTDSKNLNFVFSNEEDYQRYWNHYYLFVPYLLIYCSCVADRLAHQLIKVNGNYEALREFKRYLTMLFWEKETSQKNNKSRAKLFRMLGQELTTLCSCGYKNKFVEADFELFFELDVFLCPKCFNDFLKGKDLPKKINKLFGSKPN